MVIFLADSIYNELKLAMIEKIEGINNMVSAQNISKYGISDLTNKTAAVKENKDLLDKAFISIKDTQVACIGMMLVCGITRIYSNLNMLVLEAIAHRSLLIQTIKKIRPYIRQLCDIYGAGPLIAKPELITKRTELQEIIEKNKKIFTTIKKDNYNIPNGNDDIYNIPEIVIILEAINKRCDDIVKLDPKKKEEVITSNTVSTVSEEARDKNYFAIEENPEDIINSTNSRLVDTLVASINIIVNICSNLFSIESMPADYKMEIMEEFFTAYAELESLQDALDEKNGEDVCSSSSYKKYYTAMCNGNVAIDNAFITSYELLKQTIDLCDRYECVFSSEINLDYYKKIICLFDDMFHTLNDNIDNYNDQVGEYPSENTDGISDTKGISRYKSDTNRFARPMKTDSINFKYNIYNLIEVAPNCPDNDYNDMSIENVVNALNNNDSAAEIFKDLISNIEAISNKNSNKDNAEDNDNNNRRGYRFTNISYSDPIAYALTLLYAFHNMLYKKQYIDIKEYLIKRLSLSGFIENSSAVDSNGRSAWEFMERFKLLPYSDYINDGSIPMICREFSFMNNVDMRTILSEKIKIENIETKSVSIDITNSDGVTENVIYENITVYNKAISLFNEIKKARFFDINSNLDFKVLITLVKSYPSELAMRDLFYNLATEYNFRSQLLAALVFLHSRDIFIDLSSISKYITSDGLISIIDPSDSGSNISDSVAKKLDMDVANLVISKYGELLNVYNFIYGFIKQYNFYNSANTDGSTNTNNILGYNVVSG